MIQDPVFVDENRSKDPFCWEIVLEDNDFAIIQTFYHDGSSAKMRRRLKFGCRLWFYRHCNGLFAFYKSNKLYLRNLTNGVVIHIPTVRKRKPSHIERFEFGFDSSSKKYKVLVWMEDEATDYCLSDVHIRTLEKDSSWRPIKETPPLRNLGVQPQVNVNGTLFWFDADGARIISFDLADETFRITKLPGEIKLEDLNIMHSVFEFEESLALVELPNTENDQERCHFEIINLWILKDVVSHQWISMLKNTIIPLEGTNLHDYYLYEVNGPEADFSARNGEILIAAADGNHQYIFLYSFLNGQFKRIRITGLDILHIIVKNHVKNYVNIEEFGERIHFYSR
ncbi:hypothetical protein FRX31_018446 [Thalictrum thalictroides]|uniref:F-box associated beta-propeller type 3 domain-containing protein n=1 Tax=Thalictrum thalictroides TaxID=46969 RepID=A0A7J6W582_THATH|nr:hypothetical protein FRX31_018446 [Thalictrum thalictroides]